MSSRWGQFGGSLDQSALASCGETESQCGCGAAQTFITGRLEQMSIGRFPWRIKKDVYPVVRTEGRRDDYNTLRWMRGLRRTCNCSDGKDEASARGSLVPAATEMGGWSAMDL